MRVGSLGLYGFLAHWAAILEGLLCGQKEVKLSPAEALPLTPATSVLLTSPKPEVWMACWIKASSVFSHFLLL